jgi:hypothetical protein
MKYRDMSVGGGMYIEFDNIGAGGERRAHRGQGVLDERMLGRKNPRRRAGGRGQPRRAIGLRKASVREQCGLCLRRGPKRGVTKRDRADRDSDENQPKPYNPSHQRSQNLRREHAASLGRKHGAPARTVGLIGLAEGPVTAFH